VLQEVKVKVPAEALTASAATEDPFTYAEAMESPQRDHWKRAMKEESTSIMLNNLYLRSDGILILLYVDNISMSYPEAATKAAIEVKAKLSEKYEIRNLGPACQFLGIEIHCEDTGISLNPNIKLDLAEDRGEKELEDIRGY